MSVMSMHNTRVLELAHLNVLQSSLMLLIVLFLLWQLKMSAVKRDYRHLHRPAQCSNNLGHKQPCWIYRIHFRLEEKCSNLENSLHQKPIYHTSRWIDRGALWQQQALPSANTNLQLILPSGQTLSPHIEKCSLYFLHSSVLSSGV